MLLCMKEDGDLQVEQLFEEVLEVTLPWPKRVGLCPKQEWTIKYLTGVQNQEVFWRVEYGLDRDTPTDCTDVYIYIYIIGEKEPLAAGSLEVLVSKTGEKRSRDTVLTRT